MRIWGRGALALLVMVLVASTVSLGLSPAGATGETGDGTQDRATSYYEQLSQSERSDGLTRAPDKSADGAVYRPAAATDKSKFAAGNMMSDAVFFNGTAMTTAAVQAFLDSQVGVCNPNNRPNVAPCLKSYSVATEDRSADAMCAGYTGLASETSAQIIFKVGNACGINQGVLLALLQKEQSLVTDDWPSAAQYTFATGYDCPDDPGVGCDPATTGFFAQVYGAAWQFKRYGNPPGTSQYYTWYPVGKVSQILYSSDPSRNCGTGPVAIWNKATAALYYYTPYQPNPAALANFFGTGDGCSEYGNRNFWGSFVQWFGSSTAGGVPAVTTAAGSDRFEAAVAISKQSYSTGGAATVYIANGLNFPDALSAAPAAVKDAGPLLLVLPDSIPASVSAEIARLHPASIQVVGGVSSVGDAVYGQLSAMVQPGKITRYAGSDRYEASRELVRSKWSGGASQLFIATGANFPDALSAGAAAGSLGAPVLLVNGSSDSLDAPTAALISSLSPSRVDIVGGPNSVSTAIETGIRSLVPSGIRYSGTDRFEVSAMLNAAVFNAKTPAPGSAYLANGFTFPDALAGAAAAGSAGSPLYVVQQSCVTAAAAAASLRPSSTVIHLLGGTNSVGPEVAKLTICR